MVTVKPGEDDNAAYVSLVALLPQLPQRTHSEHWEYEHLEAAVALRAAADDLVSRMSEHMADDWYWARYRVRGGHVQRIAAILGISRQAFLKRRARRHVA